MDLKQKSLLLIFLTVVISGFSIFINSFGVKGFDSSVFAFSKNVIVAILLFAVILGTSSFKELKTLTKKQWSKLITIGLIGGSIPFLLFFKGLQLTTGTTSAFIHKTLFIYATIFALLFLKEKLTKGLFIGAALLLIGNYFLLRPNLEFSLGHILIISATIFWAAENTLAKHTLKELSGNTVAFGRMFFGSLFILAFLFTTGKASIITTMSFQQYMWILITAVFLLLYVFTYYNGLKHIKLTTAVCILSLGSPITTTLAYLFKGATLSLHQSVGMLLIFAGVVSVIWFTHISSYISSLVKHHERS